MNYWLVVRFIGKCVCAISNENIIRLRDERRTLRCDTEEAIKVESIEVLKELNIF